MLWLHEIHTMMHVDLILTAGLLLGSAGHVMSSEEFDVHGAVCVPMTTHLGPFESRTPSLSQLIEALFDGSRAPSLQGARSLLGIPAFSREYSEDQSEMVWIDANLRIDISISCDESRLTGYENRVYVTRHSRFVFRFQSDEFVSCTFDTSTIFSQVPWDLPVFGASPFDVSRDCQVKNYDAD